LYKLIYDDIASDYRIEFIEDIELKDNEGIIEIESTELYYSIHKRWKYIIYLQ